MACATLANRSPDVPRSYRRDLYRALLSFALPIQLMPGLCFCRPLFTDQPDNTHPPDLSLCITCITSYGKCHLSGNGSPAVGTGRTWTKNIGKIRRPESDFRSSIPGTRIERHWPVVACIKLRSPRIGLCSLYRLSLPYFTAFNGDFC